mmetsp:Transcript_11663/g.31325  ORF Transcript_11663/g.31325 Transcript_11663/m.31325 type:complete len:247 (-) Transcript_11663:166-906(-)|eukprot:CAMPEP_0117534934 /NCGR_PEP_ID=MMETSP0784-20121206/40671_1 /TAXON_ID=39447 /ORGANISM="" /LENGTH=246 /DNA_ID=CAMNT_0005331437 /DNA_START=93 /DNA_END=833 /DNA_ORIENTATION=+
MALSQPSLEAKQDAPSQDGGSEPTPVSGAELPEGCPTTASQAVGALQQPTEGGDGMPEAVESALPSDAELTRHVAEALAGRDLQSVTVGMIRGELERRTGLAKGALDVVKSKIFEIVKFEIQRIQAGEESAPDPDDGKRTPKKGRKRWSRDSTPRGEASTPARKRRVHAGGDEACPKGEMTRSEFKEATLVAQLGDQTLKLSPKVFSSGSCGFMGIQKVKVNIGGRSVELQCQVHCAAAGSKEWTD